MRQRGIFAGVTLVAASLTIGALLTETTFGVVSQLPAIPPPGAFGGIEPIKLPRTQPAPVTLSIGFESPPVEGSTPNLGSIDVEISRHITFETAGLPSCPSDQLCDTYPSRILPGIPCRSRQRHLGNPQCRDPGQRHRAPPCLLLTRRASTPHPGACRNGRTPAAHLRDPLHDSKGQRRFRDGSLGLHAGDGAASGTMREQQSLLLLFTPQARWRIWANLFI
jgi:hypothetical protein